jgi:hypothetical protein
MKTLQNAILTTPDRWGQTGRAIYTGKGSWTFHPDEPSVASTTHPRSEICIPRLDRTKHFTPPSADRRKPATLAWMAKMLKMSEIFPDDLCVFDVPASNLRRVNRLLKKSGRPALTVIKGQT